MKPLAASDPFEDLVARWRARRGRAAALEALGAVAALCALGGLSRRRSLELGVLAVALGLAALWTLWNRREHASDRDLLARHLDRTLASAQESSDLLSGSLPRGSVLAALQRGRVRAALAAAPTATLLPRRRSRLAAARAAAGALIAALLVTFASIGSKERPAGAESPAAAIPTPPVEARIESVQVVVHPPAYTGRPARSLAGLDGLVEEGARVEWTVTTVGAVADARIDWVDGSTPLLEREANRRVGSRELAATQVYAIRLVSPDGREVRSPYARLTVIADEEPTVRFVRPREAIVERPAAAVGSLELEVEASDDYGLADVALVATLAIGSGEGVTFDERRMDLSGEAGAPRFRRRLDLAALGLAPGSELYLFAEARDRRQPSPNVARSQPLRVRIGDPAAAASALARGLLPGRPEDYFRSQRQIILDTERLIAEAPRLGREDFERRSQSLGFDQMALRLRYGELLGEEFESGAPAAEEGEEGGSPGGAGGPSPLTGLPEGLVHFHDSMESATYFDDPLRRELKRMLGVMWQAEGRLRIIDPKGALRHELEALRLLKEIQRRSRAYVAKTGGTQPQVLLERRLSGDLSKVRDVVTRGTSLPPRPADAERALDALRAARRAGASPTVATALGDAEIVLARAAAAGRLVDLDALDAVREASEALRGGESALAAIWPRIEAGLWQAAAQPAAAPATPPPGGAGGESLFERYRVLLALRAARLASRAAAR